MFKKIEKYKLLIKFPTRERPQKFFKVLDKYYDNLSDIENTMFIISCDIDDVTMNNKTIINKLKKYRNLYYYFSENKTKVQAINNNMDILNDWDIVLLASDDMIPQVEGYDDIIRDEMKKNYKNTDGVLWFYDGYRTDLNTLCILGKKYYDRFGYIYNPEYTSLWCDNEFTEVGDILNKQIYINNCIIKHEHLIWTNSPNDNLATKNEKFYNEDFKIYEYRKSLNFNLKPNKKKIISKLNKFVDEIYVINLERRQDRLIHMTNEFKKINVNFKKFIAVDSNDLKVHKDKLKNSQLACLRSHIGVLKDAIEKGYDKIAVFEDDIVFCNDFEKRFDYYAENIPKDWDVMFLGCNLLNSHQPIQVKPFIYKIIDTYGCFAMILNNKNGLFQKIVDMAKDEIKPIDNYFYDDVFKIFIGYVFVPFFVKTLCTESDICENTHKFSYDDVDMYFKDEVNLMLRLPIKFINYEIQDEKIKKINTPLEKPLPPQKPIVDYKKSDREICEDYMKNTRQNFIIIHNNILLFDSSNSDRTNLYFFEDSFTLYGRRFSYRGMTIRNK